MRYRADIDGLRAVAILTVVAFHAIPAALPGGFIGVDIFFVISGYLISGIILGELIAERFTISAFYGRRIRRIFPALVLVLVACLLAGRYILFPQEFEALGRHTFAGAAFIANLALWRDTNYFAIEASRLPLLHLWSLGIEEQFYIFWPLVLWLTRKNLRRAFWTIVAVILVSFAANLVGIYVWGRETFTFYIPFTRVWELACGSLLAVMALQGQGTKGALLSSSQDAQSVDTPLGTRTSEAKALAGLALILAGLAVVNRELPFPGWRALLPIGGAMLLIWAGPQTWVNRVLLSNRIAVFIGLISFPLYLWHWPLLTFQGILWPESAPARALAVALAVVLATLTYIYIERPVRSSRKVRARLTVLLFIGNCVVGGLGALAYQNHLGRPVPSKAAEVLAAADDWEFPDTTALDRKGRLQLLRLDSAKPDDVTLYIGDSHVQQYWPRLTYLSHERSATINAIEFASYAGCAPLPGVNRIERDFKCPEFFQQAIEAAQSDKVKVVVFEGWWEWYFLPDSPGALHLVGDSSLRPLSLDSPEGSEVLRQFGDLLRRLVGSHKRVYIMLSNPTSPQFDPLSMVERVTYRLTPHESISRDEFEQRAGPIVNRVREVAIQAGATVVDPAEYLCDATRCPGVSPNGLPLFKDSNHLRASYARQQQYLDPFNF